MNISIEKTPKQVLSHYAVDTASAVSITHLPGTHLSKVKDAAIELNEIAGSAKAVMHIGARNIQTESELHETCVAAKKAGIDKILCIGGSTYEGKVYQNVFDLYNQLAPYGFELSCGVYPQSESFNNVDWVRYNKFRGGGITQLCFNPKILNNWIKKTKIGVPSNCSLKGLYKYIRLCGLTDSLAHALGNLKGMRYVTTDGFNTVKFVKDLNGQDIHIYNFGKLDQTLMQLEFK